MAFGDTGATPQWLNDKMALLTLVRKQRREITMLRSFLPGEPLASTHCPICFRDRPHAVDLHERDDDWLKHLPPSGDLNNDN